MDLQRQRGVTLTELLIAISLSGLLGLGLATFLSRQGSLLAKLKAGYALSTLAHRIETAAGNLQVLKASAESYPLIDPTLRDGNTLLYHCLNAESSSDCTATNPNAQVAFALVLPGADALASAEAIKRLIIAGGAPGSNTTIRYTVAGEKCGQVKTGDEDPQGKCEVYAAAQFWASCPASAEMSSNQVTRDATDTEAARVDSNIRSGDKEVGMLPTSCKVAETINIRFLVQHLPGIKAASNPNAFGLIPAIPALERFYSSNTFGAVSTRVALIPAVKNYGTVCPPNYTATNVKDGQSTCECLFPFAETATEFVKVCVAVATPCAANQRFRGIYKHDPNVGNVEYCQKLYTAADNGAPICCNVKCITKILDDVNDQCDDGYWLEEIQAHVPTSDTDGACTLPVCDIGKDVGDCTLKLTCRGTITCCTEPTSNQPPLNP